MNAYGDNPAARLLSIVEEGMKSDASQSCLQVWRQLVGPAQSDLEVASKVGKLMVLPELIVTQLREIDPLQAEAATHMANQFTIAFMTQHMHKNWGTFRDHIDVHTLASLRLISRILQIERGVPLISDEKLAELRELFSGALARVQEGQLAPGLSTFLVARLQSILTAIDDYKINGSEPIIDRIEGVIGHAYVDEEYKDFLKTDPIGAEIGDIVQSALGKLKVQAQIAQLTHHANLLSN